MFYATPRQLEYICYATPRQLEYVCYATPRQFASEAPNFSIILLYAKNYIPLLTTSCNIMYSSIVPSYVIKEQGIARYYNCQYYIAIFQHGIPVVMLCLLTLCQHCYCDSHL